MYENGEFLYQTDGQRTQILFQFFGNDLGFRHDAHGRLHDTSNDRLEDGVVGAAENERVYLVPYEGL